MHDTTFGRVDWRPIFCWLAVVLITGQAAWGETEGEDCDEMWSEKAGVVAFSENCEYYIGLGTLYLPDGSVTQELTQTCPGAPTRPTHRLTFRFRIDAGQLDMSFDDRFGIFELWDDNEAAPERIVYLELIEKGIIESKQGLVLNWRADGLSSGQESTTAFVDPSGSIVEVEWARSFDGDNDHQIDANGVIRLFLDDQLIAEVTGLMIEDRLPSAVSYGAFEALGTGIEGILMFQPLDYSSRYYRNQGPVPGLP